MKAWTMVENTEEDTDRLTAFWDDSKSTWKDWRLFTERESAIKDNAKVTDTRRKSPLSATATFSSLNPKQHRTFSKGFAAGYRHLVNHSIFPWPIMKFPDFPWLSRHFLNSLTFPDFPGFPEEWEPCLCFVIRNVKLKAKDGRQIRLLMTRRPVAGLLLQ